jgi:hypothetical protein
MRWLRLFTNYVMSEHIADMIMEMKFRIIPRSILLIDTT